MEQLPAIYDSVSPFYFLSHSSLLVFNLIFDILETILLTFGSIFFLVGEGGRVCVGVVKRAGGQEQTPVVEVTVEPPSSLTVVVC